MADRVPASIQIGGNISAAVFAELLHIIAFEGDSRVVSFAGNYQAYEEDRKKRLGEDARPTRVKYRKLVV